MMGSLTISGNSNGGMQGTVWIYNMTDKILGSLGV